MFDLRFLDSGERQKAVKYATVISILGWLLSGIVLEDILLSGLLGLLCFFPGLGILLYYPRMQRKKYGQHVEACLPLTLLNIAVELNLGMPFIKAIEHAGKSKNCCGKEFRTVEMEIREQGASVQESLMHFAERVESRLVKRAATQLAAAFEQGKGKKCGEPIKRIATEILTRQKLESKLFSGKMVVSSLLFIAVSAIVPALFQSFSIVGSVVLQLSFTAMQLFLIIVVLFPVLDLAVLLYIRSRTPVFLRGQ